MYGHQGLSSHQENVNHKRSQKTHQREQKYKIDTVAALAEEKLPEYYLGNKYESRCDWQKENNRAYEVEIRRLRQHAVIKDHDKLRMQNQIGYLKGSVKDLKLKRCSECEVIRKQLIKCTEEYDRRKTVLDEGVEKLQSDVMKLWESLQKPPDINQTVLKRNYNGVHEWLFSKYHDWETLLKTNCSVVRNQMVDLMKALKPPLDTDQIKYKISENDMEDYARGLQEQCDHLESQVVILQDRLFKNEEDLHEKERQCQKMYMNNESLMMDAENLAVKYDTVKSQMKQIYSEVFEKEMWRDEWKESDTIQLSVKMSKMREKDHKHQIHIEDLKASFRKEMADTVTNLKRVLGERLSEMIQPAGRSKKFSKTTSVASEDKAQSSEVLQLMMFVDEGKYDDQTTGERDSKYDREEVRKEVEGHQDNLTELQDVLHKLAAAFQSQRSYAVEVTEDHHRLKTENRVLQTELNEMKQNVENFDTQGRKLQGLLTEVSGLQQEISRLTHEKDQLQTDQSTLLKENVQLQSEVKEKELEKRKLESDIQKNTEEYNILECQHKQLIAKHKKSKSDLSDAMQRCNKLQEQVKDGGYLQERTTYINDILAQLQSVQNRNKSLEVSVETIEKEKTKLEMHLTKAQEDINHYKQKKGKLQKDKHKLEVMLKEKDATEQQYQEWLTLEQDKSKSNLSELRERNERLQGMLKDRGQTEASLKVKDEELNSIKGQVAKLLPEQQQLIKENENLENAIKKVQEDKHQLEVLYNNAQADLKQYEQNELKLMEDIRIVKERHVEEVLEKDTTVQETEDEKHHLQSQLDHVHQDLRKCREHHAMELSELQTKMSELSDLTKSATERCTELESEKIRLSQELAEQRQAYVQQQNQLDSCKENCKKLLEANKEFQKVIETKDLELKQQHHQYEQEIAIRETSLREQHRNEISQKYQMTEMHQGHEKVIVEKDNTIKQLRNEIDAVKHKNTAMDNRHEEEIMERENNIRQLQNEIDAVKHKNQTLENKMKQFQDDLTKEKAKIQKLKRQEAELLKANDDLENQCRSLKDKIEEILESRKTENTDNISRMEHKIEELTHTNVAKEKEIKELLKVVANVEMNLQQLQSDHENLNAVIKQKDTNIKDLTQRHEKVIVEKENTIKQLRNEIDAVKHKKTAMENRHKDEIMERENSIRQLQNEIDAVKHKNQTMKNTIKQFQDDLTKEKAKIQKLKRQEAELLKANDDLENQCRSLKDKIEEILESHKTENTDHISRMEHKIEELTHTNVAKEKELKELLKAVANLEMNLQQLQSDHENLNAVIKQKDTNIKDLTQRLSSEMGTKLAADESSLENISIKNRPMNIATEYDLLCSNEWLNAKTDLDDACPKMDDDDKVKILCDVLVISVKEGTKLKTTLFQTLVDQSLQPGILIGPESKSGKRNFKDQLLNSLLDFLRESADDSNLSQLVKAVKAEVAQKYQHIEQHLDISGMDEYLKATALITWKMVLQRPPMVLSQKGIGLPWQGEKKQEVFWKSDDPTNPKSKVKYYVHPELYHGDSLMVKGRVYLSARN